MNINPGLTDEDVAVFLSEAEELIHTLEEGLLNLEGAGDDGELIASVFRAAHTLKGSSATLGHTRMAKLTHAMETVLDDVRHGRLNPDRGLVDALLSGVDALRLLLGEVTADGEVDVDIDGLVESLERARQGAGSAGQAQEAPPASAVGAAEARTGARLVKAYVSIDPTCPMPAVRAYQVIDRVTQSCCEVVETSPDMATIESGECGHEFSFVMAVPFDEDDLTEFTKSVEGLIKEISDITDVRFEYEGAELVQPSGQTASTAENGEIEDVQPAGSPAAADAAPAASARKVAEDQQAGVGRGAAKRPEAGIGGRSGNGGSGGSSGPSSAGSQMVRVGVERLDKLMNLVAELVIDRTRLTQLEMMLEARYGSTDIIEDLKRTSVHVGRITVELQEEIMKARMLPVENVFKRFPRMMRDLAKNAGKEIDFIIEGQETELDRSVIEEIGDPLIHLLRNAVGHGIEPPEERVAQGKPRKGTVKLSAYHEENYIVITVEDDGRGIDPEKIKAAAVAKGAISKEAAERLSSRDAVNLIFLPGLSTAQKVDDISGRGVGMDIVRKNIEKLNGTIGIQTEVGRGTKFVVKLPLTLAIIRALLVEVMSKIYAIPLTSVVEVVRIRREEQKTVKGRPTMLLRGNVLPLLTLSDVFGFAAPEVTPAKVLVVVLSAHDEKVGLVVDRLLGEQEIVIKNISDVLGNVSGISGVTILGDGRVAPILDVPSMVRAVEGTRAQADERAV